ncbi:MAG: endonuclease/exonuclease/phosphatase family protein [Nannocystaceae bacterium]
MHWRSRLRSNGNPYRGIAAQTLYGDVEHDLQQNVPVVVLGDFNDEPFDASLASLGASRDPRLVLRHPKHRLYNPSWSLSAPTIEAPWARFGSLGHNGRTSTRYLYDQALTSAHFLDEDAGTIPKANLRELVPDPATGSRIIDHLPLELTLP